MKNKHNLTDIMRKKIISLNKASDLSGHEIARRSKIEYNRYRKMLLLSKDAIKTITTEEISGLADTFNCPYQYLIDDSQEPGQTKDFKNPRGTKVIKAFFEDEEKINIMRQEIINEIYSYDSQTLHLAYKAICHKKYGNIYNPIINLQTVLNQLFPFFETYDILLGKFPDSTTDMNKIAALQDMFSKEDPEVDKLLDRIQSSNLLYRQNNYNKAVSSYSDVLIFLLQSKLQFNCQPFIEFVTDRILSTIEKKRNYVTKKINSKYTELENNLNIFKESNYQYLTTEATKYSALFDSLKKCLTEESDQKGLSCSAHLL